jgi:hypothetical protein
MLDSSLVVKRRMVLDTGQKRASKSPGSLIVNAVENVKPLPFSRLL